MEFQIEDIGTYGFSFNTGDYRVTLFFYHTSWAYSHRIDVEREGERIDLDANLELVKEVLKRLASGSKSIWRVLQLVNLMSWKVKSKTVEDFILSKDYSKLLKSVYLSMVYTRYSKTDREKIKSLVRELVEAKEVPSNNKWVKKILDIENKVFWDTVFRDSWFRDDRL